MPGILGKRRHTRCIFGRHHRWSEVAKGSSYLVTDERFMAVVKERCRCGRTSHVDDAIAAGSVTRTRVCVCWYARKVKGEPTGAHACHGGHPLGRRRAAAAQHRACTCVSHNIVQVSYRRSHVYFQSRTVIRNRNRLCLLFSIFFVGNLTYKIAAAHYRLPLLFES